MWGQHLLENWARMPVVPEIASEFRYRNVILEPDDMVLVISQSGDTADTLAALRLAKEKGCIAIALCNVVGSSIPREADAVIYTQAGPEISVASTKAMCSQMVIMALIMASVPPQVTSTSSSGLTSCPRRGPAFAASASRKFSAPKVTEY